MGADGLVGVTRLATQGRCKVSGDHCERRRIVHRPEDAPRCDVGRTVAHEVGGAALPDPAGMTCTVALAEAAMVEKSQPRHDVRPPAVDRCLELVDAVPSDTLLERQNKLQALAPVGA